MRILNKSEVLLKKEKILHDIKHGSIFIYPTDTIYGIGCNALNENSIKKIRQLKERYHQPFSIIAPNVEWIKENCVVSKKSTSWLKKLPGPYTFVLKLKNKLAISNYVNPGIDTLGVRIPDHWFTELIKDLNLPIITTSVNKHGEEYMTSLEDLDPDIKNNVDYVFYDKEITGKPSTLVRFDKKGVEVKER